MSLRGATYSESSVGRPKTALDSPAAGCGPGRPPTASLWRSEGGEVERAHVDDGQVRRGEGAGEGTLALGREDALREVVLEHQLGVRELAVRPVGTVELDLGASARRPSPRSSGPSSRLIVNPSTCTSTRRRRVAQGDVEGGEAAASVLPGADGGHGDHLRRQAVVDADRSVARPAPRARRRCSPR